MSDLRQSLRQLLRKPVFTITAVLTLAIGMGVNTVAFSVINGVLFKSFALSGMPGVGRIVTLPGGDESGYASFAEYQRFRVATNEALDVAAEGRSSVAWKRDGSTETAWVLYVSKEYFSLIPPPVMAGRLDVQRDGGTISVMIGERFWREQLNARSLAGLSLRLNNTDVTVAGVIKDGWHGPAGIYSPQIWLPLDDAGLFGASTRIEDRDTRWLFVLGRLRDGVEAARVNGLVETAAAEMAREWPGTHHARTARFQMLGSANSEIRGMTYAASIMMAIIGLVLLLACFNVANLLLARAVERERDLGIRAALGARPGRLMRLVVTEGFLIALMSGALALVLASWTQSLVRSFAIPIEQPQTIDMAPDATVVLFIGALIVIAGVLPGLWPAITAARIDVLRVLGAQSAVVGARPSRLRGWLVGAQIAGSTMFLAIAALFMQSYASVAAFDLGFAKDHLVLAEFAPSSSGYDTARAAQFVSAFAERARALPGVTSVAIADNAPFFVGFDDRTVVWPPDVTCDGGHECREHSTYNVSAGYFATLGVPMAEGRELTGTPGEAVINAALARLLWPNGAALGQSIRIGRSGERVTIVGVAATTPTRGVNDDRPVLFLPLQAADYARQLTLVARTAGAPATMVRAVQEAAHAVDANVALTAVKTMEQRMAVQLWPFRTVTWVFSICGGLALILATVGLAGVVIHAVNRRIREFGVRLSVGATPRDLIADVLRSAARMLIPGIAAGLLLAVIAARAARAMLIGVDVLDPTTYAAVAVVQAVIVLIACLGPALKASRVDPLTALRAE